MAQIRKGDYVRAFLNANMHGVVEEIKYKQQNNALMIGGVPPSIAIAYIRNPDGKVYAIRTTELFVEKKVQSW